MLSNVRSFIQERLIIYIYKRNPGTSLRRNLCKAISRAKHTQKSFKTANKNVPNRTNSYKPKTLKLRRHRDLGLSGRNPPIIPCRDLDLDLEPDPIRNGSRIGFGQIQARVPGGPVRGQDQHHHALHVRQVRQHLSSIYFLNPKFWILLALVDS